jgi:hypothetical protein
VIGRGVDSVNLPKENEQYAAANNAAAMNTSLLNNSQQNNGNLYGAQYTTTSPTGSAQVTQTQNPLTGNTTTTTKSYNSQYQASPLTDMYKEKMLQSESGRPSGFDYDDFDTSALTDRYRNLMKETESAKPEAYQSKYEATIDEILNTIKNRQAFDVTSDANYRALYDQYAERYKANAQRAMNDAMASANAATGGYGSTYGQAVGQQAYDRTMEGLNDNNMALLNLAYQIYEGDRANDYNMLGAYQNQDNTMYGRYRDDVSDWQNDRAYYAGQYQQNYANDRSAYDTDRSFAYNQYRDNVSDWENDRAYNSGQYWNSYGSDYQVTQDEYKRDDANYQDALTQAMALAKEGLPVPSYITDRINQYNAKYGLSGDATAALAQLAATAAAGSGGSGGSGGRKRSRKSSSKKTEKADNSTPVVNNEDVLSMYNTIKKNSSGTVLDRINADDYLEDVMNNSLIDFAPRLAGYSNFTDQVTRKYSKTGESVTDTLNRLAYEKALKKKK